MELTNKKQFLNQVLVPQLPGKLLLAAGLFAFIFFSELYSYPQFELNDFLLRTFAVIAILLSALAATRLKTSNHASMLVFMLILIESVLRGMMDGSQAGNIDNMLATFQFLIFIVVFMPIPTPVFAAAVLGVGFIRFALIPFLHAGGLYEVTIASVTSFFTFAIVLIIGNGTLLKLRLKGLMRTYRLEQKAAEYEELAHRDPLTGLSNLRRFKQVLPKAMQYASSNGNALTLCLIDLNDFKKINDQFGHIAGDDALQALADVMKRVIASYGEAFRLGGDEFAILLYDHTPEQARHLCQTAALYMKQTERIPNHINLYCSFGIAQFSKQFSTPRQFLQAADEALYKSKECKSDGMAITVA